MRTLSPELITQLNLVVTRPGYLVQIQGAMPVNTTLNFSTLGNVTWGGRTWLSSNLKVSGLSRDTSVKRTATLEFGNLDGAYSSIALSMGTSEIAVNIWTVYAGAPDDAVLEFQGIVDGATIGDKVVMPLVGVMSERVFLPRRRINAASGFNTLIASGTMLSVGAAEYQLRSWVEASKTPFAGPFP